MRDKSLREQQNSIAILAHNLESGGAAVACARLVASFRQAGFEVETHLVNQRKIVKQKINAFKFGRISAAIYSRVDIIFCKYLSPDGNHWASTGLIGQISAKKILKENPPFLNIHWIGHATISLKQISKINIPMLITSHDEWWLNGVSHYSTPNSLEAGSLARKQILKYILRKKEKILNLPNVGIVCLSQEMLEKFILVYPNLRGRVRIIPNPVDDSIFHPLELGAKLFAVPTAAYLGGFSDTRKGYDLLLEVLKKCTEKFNVVATGFEGELLTGTHKQIRMIGIPKISDGKVLNELYNNVEITIVPSRQEALPQVATESLMSGTPVISFRVGGLRDILFTDRSGITIDNFDTTTFAEKLDSCMKIQLKREIKPEIFANENFAPSIVVEKYLDFYESLNTR